MKRVMVLISTLAAALMIQVSPAFAQDSGSLDQYSGNLGGNQAGEPITLTGVVEKPEGTMYQYGTHGLSDWDSGYYALQSDTVDLDAYVGQRVDVHGTLVPGYENAQVEGGPPLVEVKRVEPIEEPGDDRVTLSFELAVEGQPPTGTSFFGFVPAEGGISTQLIDPDGDGLYTGSMDVPQYAPGPRPVPEGIEPVTLPVEIVQAVETRDGLPLNPTTIKDFGGVLMDEDKTFSASISFEDTPEPTTLEPTAPEPTTVDSGGNGSTDSSAVIDILPDTGGTSIPLLGAIALLTGGGLLFLSLRLMGLLRRH
ncbi:MAG: hypothetical protein WA982_03480 [Rubrobacteraceae bacterium]